MSIMTNLELERAIDGCGSILIRGGKVIPLKLTPDEKALYRKFCEQGFAYIESDSRAFQAYSEWCSVNKKPQIYFRKKVKYAFIELDMILTDYYLSAKAQSLISDIFRTYYRGKRQSAAGCCSHCHYIPNNSVEIVAQQLSEIANDKNNWQLDNI